MAFQAAHSHRAQHNALDIDEVLLASTIVSTKEGLQMTGVTPSPVGASRLPTGEGEYSVLVSLEGAYAGTVQLSLSKHAALFLAGRFLGETLTDVDDDLMDCLSELGNMVAGRFKENLRETEYEVDAISLPALIMGNGFHLYHARGIQTASVTFEIEPMPMFHMRERFFTTTISLMKK